MAILKVKCSQDDLISEHVVIMRNTISKTSFEKNSDLVLAYKNSYKEKNTEKIIICFA